MNYLERLHGEAEGDDTVARLVSRKGEEVWSVTPSDSVADSIALMCEQDIGVVLVIDGNENGRLVGILSERDCLRRVVAQGLDPACTPVSEVMTRDVVAAWPLQRQVDGFRSLWPSTRVPRNRGEARGFHQPGRWS